MAQYSKRNFEYKILNETDPNCVGLLFLEHQKNMVQSYKVF